jgi:hypothetical protein
MRYLIRLAKTKVDEWVNGVGIPQVLAQNIFRLKKVHRNDLHDVCEESTYLVDGPLEEMRVAAAHLLADDDPKIETRYLVRILLSDANAAGLRVEDSTIGGTGVGWVDYRHRDLVGTKEEFLGLVAVILGRLREGEDRIRRIGKPQYEHALQHFAGLPATERPTHTRAVIECVLNKTSVADLKPDIALAKEELARLTIPEETISLRAFCLQRDGNSVWHWSHRRVVPISSSRASAVWFISHIKPLVYPSHAPNVRSARLASPPWVLRFSLSLARHSLYGSEVSKCPLVGWETYRTLKGMLYPDGRVTLPPAELPDRPVRVMITILQAGDEEALSEPGDYLER